MSICFSVRRDRRRELLFTDDSGHESVNLMFFSSGKQEVFWVTKFALFVIYIIFSAMLVALRVSYSGDGDPNK